MTGPPVISIFSLKTHEMLSVAFKIIQFKFQFILMYKLHIGNLLEYESDDASMTSDLPVFKRLWKLSSSKLRISGFSISLGSNLASAVLISIGDWLLPAAFLKLFDQLAGPA